MGEEDEWGVLLINTQPPPLNPHPESSKRYKLAETKFLEALAEAKVWSKCG